MTIREAISQIKQEFKKVNADSRLTNKLVWSLICKHSKWIIHRDSQRLKILTLVDLFQIQNCVKVIEAPINDSCCNLKKELKCKIYRTEKRIKDVYGDFSGPIIKGVYSLDFSKSFTIYTPKEYKRLKKDIFSNKDELRGYYHDGYLYFPDTHINIVQIEALFLEEIDNSESCDPCENCDKKPCKKYLDRRWIIPARLEAVTLMEVLKELSSLYIQLPEKSNEINKIDN